MARYAEVVVNQTVRSSALSREVTPDVHRPSEHGTFHYRVPEHLQGKLDPGQIIWVPFGPRRLQGVLLAFADESPVADTKDIEGILDARPALSAEQLLLARWISDYYLCPLADAVRLMIPPGISQRLHSVATLKAAPPWPGSITEEQRTILDELQKRGAIRLRHLSRKFRSPRFRVAMAELERLGLIERQAVLSEPRVQPLVGRFVQLVASRGEIEAALPRLGRSTQASRLLDLLARSEQPVWLLDEALERADASRAAVRALEQDGVIAVQAKRDLCLIEVRGSQLKQALAELQSRAPKQAAALEVLHARGGTEDASVLRREFGISTDALRALEEKGLVRRVTEEARIHLAASRSEALERLIALQGARLYRDILSVLQSAERPVWLSWLYAETGCTLDDIRTLAEQGLVALVEEEVERSPLAGRKFGLQQAPTLTPDQQRVWEGIRSLLSSGNGEVALLHGVTGSGKTEIYLRALAQTLRAGKQAIVLVPEIALTPQTITRFASRFPGQVSVLHSGLSIGERFDQWRAIRDGKYSVVVGARSAVFAPVPRLGLIVVDEEHEPSYKQTKTPRYHARDVAIERARITGATVILGSATPDLVTYYRAQKSGYRVYELPKRIVWSRDRLERDRAQLRGKVVSVQTEGPVAYSDLPQVQIVDLRKELLEGNRSIFSRALQRALTETLAAGQQAILFLNRRGTASFVMCRECGHVIECRRCELPLTYHSARERLMCHHCNHQEPVPRLCPACGSAQIRYFGLGTEKVEQVTQQMFPAARLLRWDWDVTRRKGAHDVILDKFSKGEADVLIGTQMVAKGLDLPRVTLVGVVSADTALYFPDFRASERTFQLLAQVAGRAGRSVLGGRVIIQTYAPGEPSIQAASKHDYAGFYAQELAFRREQGYPPFTRMARLLFYDSSLRRCREEGERMRAYLQDRVRRLGLAPVEITGPAPCFLPRLRGLHRWHILVRCSDPFSLLANLAHDPQWRIDVDPVELL